MNNPNLNYVVSQSQTCESLALWDYELCLHAAIAQARIVHHGFFDLLHLILRNPESTPSNICHDSFMTKNDSNNVIEQNGTLIIM